MEKTKKSWLPRINIALAVVILLINGYIFVAPVLPRFSLWLRTNHAKATSGLPYKTQLDAHSKQSNGRKAIPTDNRLVIPRLALDEHIYQGTSPYLVNKGVWARPATSTPPEGSNTVLVGHRFTYDGPATFYSLDKVSVGDKLVLYWGGKEYDYAVNAVKVVPPTATEVEGHTTQPELTVYTCTPLWSAKDRLVVIAKLMQPGASQ